jgi:hypothetical protein
MGMYHTYLARVKSAHRFLKNLSIRHLLGDLDLVGDHLYRRDTCLLLNSQCLDV